MIDAIVVFAIVAAVIIKVVSVIVMRRESPVASPVLGLSDGAFAALRAIDPVPLVRRLVRTDGFTPADAEIAVAEYRGFLAIAAAYGPEMLAPPSEACDQAWHAHILHTEMYDHDMRAIFGAPFHHYPADDTDNMEAPQARTNAILSSLPGLGIWIGLDGAKGARGIPLDIPLSDAAILGLMIAAGELPVRVALVRPATRGGGSQEAFPLPWMEASGSGSLGSSCHSQTDHTRGHHGHGSACSASSGSASSGSGSSDSGSSDSGSSDSGHSCGGHSHGGHSSCSGGASCSSSSSCSSGSSCSGGSQ
jgi:uncharacterized membrane protein YgcG